MDALRSTSSHVQRETTDFVHEKSTRSARRLSLLCMAYAMLGGIYLFVLPKPAAWHVSGVANARHLVGFTILPLAFIASLLLWRKRVRPRHFPLLAFAVEITGAVGMEIESLFLNAAPVEMAGGLSWTAVWITAFPFFVPATPLQTFVGSVASASVRPLILGILALSGVTLPEIAVIVHLVIPTYLCVATAVLGSAIVYGLGCEANRAQHMGSYRLLAKLGDGGMGEVWTARHRFLTRPAAIKIVQHDGTKPLDRVKLTRFEREVQAAAQLRSQHTIDIYDYGVTEAGTFYYVMELLDGMDLERLVRTSGPLDPGRVVHLLRQVCHSLAEAHARGIVHRDIKPANIFLCRYGLDFDVVKVLDFGLVKSMHARNGLDSHLTKAGLFYGTPAYASPEVAMGQQEDVDARSDIYSLGCVAYWLLVGETVFPEQAPMATLIKQVSAPPLRPSMRTTRCIPEGLDVLVLRCLAKHPDDRVQSAHDLMTELEVLQLDHMWTRTMAQTAWDTWRAPPNLQVTSLHTGPNSNSNGPTLQVQIEDRRAGEPLDIRTVAGVWSRVARQLLY